MIARRPHDAFTLTEVLVSIAATLIIMGALVASASVLRRSAVGTENYSSSHASQIRLIDTVATDLRNAIGLATTNPSSNVSTKLTSGWTTIITTRWLTITLPGYYQSDDPADSGYRQRLDLISTGNNVRYGTPLAVAPNTTVRYEKVFLPSENSLCFIRRQGADVRIIARDAEDLDLDITVAQGGRSCVVEVWFESALSRTGARVECSDSIMLRNRRYD